MPTPAPDVRYWFVLGRESLIAAAEIDAVLGLKKYDYSPPILKVEPPPAGGFESKKIINRLGGTIKIARELAENIKEKEMERVIIDELKTVSGKINFGLSFYNSSGITLKEVKILGLQIKKALKAEGYSVRYVENKEETLSSVTVEKNGLTERGREFLIQKNQNNAFSLART